MRVGADPAGRGHGVGLVLTPGANAVEQPAQPPAGPHVQRPTLDERLFGHVQCQQRGTGEAARQRRQRAAQPTAQVEHGLHLIEPHRFQPLDQPALDIGQQEVCPALARTPVVEGPAYGQTI